MLAKATERGIKVDWILETHAHADHLTAAPHLKVKTGAQVVIGEHIREVQKIFKEVFNASDVSGDGREFDRLVRDGDRLALGTLEIEVMHLPGHTPADVAYRIGDAVFVGDTIFMPDYGTARADFPGGDAAQLYRSIRRLLSLPPETRLFMCHDYKAPGRDHYAWQTTVADERAHNIHVHDGRSETEFVALRTKRDASLAAPVLLLPSVQVNIRAGHFPPPDSQRHQLSAHSRAARCLTAALQNWRRALPSASMSAQGDKLMNKTIKTALVGALLLLATDAFAQASAQQADQARGALPAGRPDRRRVALLRRQADGRAGATNHRREQGRRPRHGRGRDREERSGRRLHFFVRQLLDDVHQPLRLQKAAL